MLWYFPPSHSVSAAVLLSFRCRSVAAAVAVAATVAAPSVAEDDLDVGGGREVLRFSFFPLVWRLRRRFFPLDRPVASSSSSSSWSPISSCG